MYPEVGGGTNWFSPSFSPQTNLFYLSAHDDGGYFLKGKAEYKPGAQFNGGGLETDSRRGARRCDPRAGSSTGELKWEFKLHSGAWAGVLSTAGNLVFAGSQ